MKVWTVAFATEESGHAEILSVCYSSGKAISEMNDHRKRLGSWLFTDPLLASDDGKMQIWYIDRSGIHYEICNFEVK